MRRRSAAAQLEEPMLRSAADGADSYPLILHFDINKTLIIADSIMNKSTEYTIREVISNQFWGVREEKVDESGDTRTLWRWDGRGPSLEPVTSADSDEDEPEAESRHSSSGAAINYLKFCRQLDADRDTIRLATRSFELVNDTKCKQIMTELADQAVRSMSIPASKRTPELQEATGLVGEWKLIFPSFFRFIAHLQRTRRRFCIFFRSFGTDLSRVQQEWNAFCEMRHPLYNEFLEDVGPMDGSVEGVPDRRLGEGSIHTMYRDADGPMLAIGTATNGNWEGEWDQWARSGQVKDTRDGRSFFKAQRIPVVQGYIQLQTWFKNQLSKRKTHILREDYAWWHHNKECSTAGKLIIGIDKVQQAFFDDNIGLSDFRIVDPRSANSFMPLRADKCLGTACIRVDPLKAMLDDSYYIDEWSKSDVRQEITWKDEQGRCQEEEEEFPQQSFWSRRQSVERTKSSPRTTETPKRPPSVARFGEGSQASEFEDSASSDGDGFMRDGGMTLTITDADSLRQLLASEGVDVEKFGAPGTTYKSVQNLHQELVDGKCCVKRKEEGTTRILRCMEVMKVRLMCNNLILCETHEQLPDGRLRSRNGYLPASKKRHSETLAECMERWAIEELQLRLTEEQKREALRSCVHSHQFTEETMSYPLPCETHYLEVCCLLRPEMMPQITLDRLGLPAGSIFSTRGMKKRGKGQEVGSMRFWSWYRTEVWEAMTMNEGLELPDVQACMEELFKNHARRNAYESLLLQMFDCFSASKLCGGLSGSLVLQVAPVDPIEGRNEEAVIVKLDKADVISRELANSKRVWNALQDRAARVFGQGCFFTDSSSVEYGAFKIELAGGCWQVPELSQAGGSKDLLSTFKDLFSVESERQLLHTDMYHLVSTCGDIEVVLLELLGPGGMLRVLRRHGLARAPSNLFSSYNYSGKDTKWNPLFGNEVQLKPMQFLWKRTFGQYGTADLPDVRQQVQELTQRFTHLQSSPLGHYRPIIGLAHGDLNAMNILIDVMDAVWIIDFAFSEEKPLCWDLAKLEIAFMFEYAVLPVYWRTLLEFAGDNPEDWRQRKVNTWLRVSESVCISLLEELQVLEQKQKQDNLLMVQTPSMVHCQNGSNNASRCSSPNHYNPRRSKESSDRRLPKRRNSINTPESFSLSVVIKKAIDKVYKDGMDRATQKKRDNELCRLAALILPTKEEEEAALRFAAQLTQTMLNGDTLTALLEPPDPPPCGLEGASLSWCWAKAARLRSFFKDEWLELQRRTEKELGGLFKADESPLVFLLGFLQESYRLLGYFDIAPWVKCWAVQYLEQLVAQIFAELSKVDNALEEMELPEESHKECLHQTDSLPPRDFPSKLRLANRVLATSASKPSPHSTRARLRAVHTKTPGISNLGGLFGEIRSVKEVHVGESSVLKAAELVRDGSFEGTVKLFFSTGEYGELEVGTISLEGAPVLSLKLAIVPLGERMLSQAERRRGIRVQGRLPDGKHVAAILAIHETAFCYPAGMRLRLAPSNMSPLRSGVKLSFGVVEHFNPRSGDYSIHFENADKNVFEDKEADPTEGNHLTAPLHSYPEGTPLLVLCRELGGFVSAQVSSPPPDGQCSRHMVTILKEGEKERRLQIDLNDLNHVRRMEKLDPEVFDEEVRRYKVFAKAKHSFIYTVTSERADVLEGPVPRTADEGGRDCHFWSEVQALISEDDDRMTSQLFFQGILILGEPGSGKSCLLLKLVMHCLSHSTMLLPVLIPVIDLCSRMKRAEDSGSIDTEGGIENDAEGLVDWYLRMVYGVDTPRYRMLRHCLACHRLLLLFDGLEEAESFTPRIERCLFGLVALDHRVVATARLEDQWLDPGTNSGSDMWLPRSCRSGGSNSSPRWPSFLQIFRVLELLPLEIECRRSLVEALLGRDQGMNHDDIDTASEFVEDFIDHLDEVETAKWSTPMMTSMLVASWREQRRQELAMKTEKSRRRRNRGSTTKINETREKPVAAVATDASDSLNNKHGPAVNVREVYRVALDLLLRRFQSRQQADRHKMKESVQKFKELLELIAAKMTLEKKEEFTEADVLPVLVEYGMDIQVWNDLAKAIRQGRVPLLQTRKTDDGSTVRFLFAYGSFLEYLSTNPDKARLKMEVMRELVAGKTRSSGSGSLKRAHGSDRSDRHTLDTSADTPSRLTPRRASRSVGPPVRESTWNFSLWDWFADLACCTSRNGQDWQPIPATEVSPPPIHQARSPRPSQASDYSGRSPRRLPFTKTQPVARIQTRRASSIPTAPRADND